jgi:hypothetical protein
MRSTPMGQVEITTLLGHVNAPRVLVAGDVMLDRYWFATSVGAHRKRRSGSVEGDLLAVVERDESSETLDRLLWEEGVHAHPGS